jgi:flagellar basal body-associated protein FliL
MAQDKGYSMQTILLISVGVIFLLGVAAIITILAMEPHRERMRHECHKQSMAPVVVGSTRE